MAKQVKLYRKLREKSRFFLTTIALFLSIPVAYPQAAFSMAAHDWYQIDLIVFRHQVPYAISERLYTAHKHEKVTTLIPVINTDDLQPYRLLPNNQKQLSRLAARLQKNHYEVLANIAWREKVVRGQRTPIVHFVGGQHFELDSADAQADDDQTDDSDWQVSGFIHTENTPNYFSIRTELLLKQPFSEMVLNDGHVLGDTALATNGFSTYYLNQQHRVRLNKLEYFDHPAFGVLLKVTPFNMPKQKSIAELEPVSEPEA